MLNSAEKLILLLPFVFLGKNKIGKFNHLNLVIVGREGDQLTNFISYYCMAKGNGDYPRTRASDSKHLPVVILNVFW